MKEKQLQKETTPYQQHLVRMESHLAQLEEKLRLETGFREIFGVVRQNAKTWQSELSQSVLHC
ncbi:hypothetical protein P4S72_22085 [Vibrio sp. PP-XX7]